jgi:hypothetical protein
VSFTTMVLRHLDQIVGEILEGLSMCGEGWHWSSGNMAWGSLSSPALAHNERPGEHIESGVPPAGPFRSSVRAKARRTGRSGEPVNLQNRGRRGPRYARRNPSRNLGFTGPDHSETQRTGARCGLA